MARLPDFVDAFCVDLEEWFHICRAETPYTHPSSWPKAIPHVVGDTEVLMRLLDEAGVRGTFLTVGWIAERYPDLIRRLVAAGHEIGCHTYYHQLIYDLTPDEFESDLQRCLEVLRGISGQPVDTFRAPSFSMVKASLWAYPILARHGIQVDLSIVPAYRDNGGIHDFPRDPFQIQTEEGMIRCLPTSVMSVFGTPVPFSGGGYFRLFPSWLIRAGFRQNHRQGRPVITYLHPREINPNQPRLKLPPLRYFKYYVNVAGTERKLRGLLGRFRFSTVGEVLGQVQVWPTYEIVNRDLRRLTEHASVPQAITQSAAR